MICHSILELHPSLCLDINNDFSENQNESFNERLEKRLNDGSVVQCGNLLELICKSNNPLEVPMCKKCATDVSSELNKQLRNMEDECVKYKHSLDQLTVRRSDSNFDQETAKRKLNLLQLEEKELIEELAALEVEERELGKSLEEKIKEREKMEERDEQLYRQLRDNHRTLIEQSEEQQSLKMQLKYAEEQLKRLQKVNVLDMVFFIWMDGEYGTINGFRLGRLRQNPVEWNEINAAFGQIAFLLTVISERFNMKFTGYTIVPCGSYSFIRTERQSGKTEELPLYGSGPWQRPFGQPSIDQAIVALVDCFSQIENKLKSHFTPGTQILPYRIIKDKIVDKDSQYLVKMQLNSEERWTKAMKCFLLNLKRTIGIIATLGITSHPPIVRSSPKPDTDPASETSSNPPS